MVVDNTYAPGARFYPYPSEAKEKVSDYSRLQPDIARLQALDRAVRAHESAHIAAGGGVVTSGAHFSFVRGPDERMYAVGGEVGIDTSKAQTPEATIAKARRIAGAALAPINPSPQDYKVASTALMMEQRARMELLRELQARLSGIKNYSELPADDRTTAKPLAYSGIAS